MKEKSKARLIVAFFKNLLIVRCLPILPRLTFDLLCNLAKV